MKVSIDLLTPNEWSRPQRPVTPRGIILHWVENAGQPARGVRSWFEGRKDGQTGYGSAHDIVGLDGEVLHVVPYDEMAYHVGADNYLPPALSMFGAYPNATTLGIEMTHPEWDGKPTPETLLATAELCAVLCATYRIDPIRNIQTHSWVTGKQTVRGPCHKWFVEHPDDLQAFRDWVLDLVHEEEKP